MLKTVFAVIPLLVGITAFSQTLKQTIKGQILDEQSRSPIIGATIQVMGIDPPLGGITDEEGYFRIENVPIGRQTLRATSVGYEPSVLPELLLSSGKELVLTISLKESLIQMEEVVVTANVTEKGQPRNELATVSAISLSVEETSRYAATFDDPARAALTYAGVQTGGDDLLNEIVIRGNSPKGILWRLEGVEIPNPNHFTSVGSSAGGISMLSSNVLANSDFFTGAFPAQYGNATSGIFDLQLRQGNFDKPEHSFRAGLLGLAASSEGPLSKNSKGSYLANYRYSTLAMLSGIGLDILGDREEIVFQDLSFKVRVPTQKFGSFSIWGLGGKNRYTFIPDPNFGETNFENEDQDLGVMGVTNVFYLNDDSFFESIISASYSKLSNNYDSMRMRVLEREGFIESQLRFSSFYNHKFSARHTIRAGVIASRLSFDLSNQFWNREDRTYIISLDEDDHAGFYQGFSNWQFRATESFTMNSGLHLSYFALNGRTYLEPRLGFKWKLGRNTLSGGFGMHSRMETIALYTARQENEDGTFSQNNKDLGFTRASHFVLGFERMLRPDLRARAEVYYQHLFDVPIWPNDTTSNEGALVFSTLNTFDGYTTQPLANNGTGRNYGVELTLEKFFTEGFYMLSTASFYESLYTPADNVERNTQFNGNFIVNFVSGKEFEVGNNRNNRFGINARVIFTGGKRQAPINESSSLIQGYTVFRYDRNYEVQLDNYFRIDLGVRYRKNNQKTASIWALDFQNFTQRENEFARYFNPFTRQIESDAQLSFLPNFSYTLEF